MSNIELDLAHKYKQEKKFEKAIEQFKKYHPLTDREYYKILKETGDCYFSLKKYALAAECYEKAYEQNSETVYYPYKAAVSHFKIGNFKESMQFCQLALYFKDIDHSILLELAEISYACRRFDICNEITIKMISQGFGDCICYTLKSEALLELNCIDAALEDVCLAEKKLDEFILDKNSYKKRSSSKSIGKCDSNNNDNNNNFISSLSDISNYNSNYNNKDIISYSSNHKTVKDLEYSIYLTKAQVLFLLKQYDQAIKYYSLASEINNKNLITSEKISYCYCYLKDYKQTIEHANIALKHKNDNLITSYSLRGIAYLNTSQISNGIEDFNKAVKLYNDCIDIKKLDENKEIIEKIVNIYNEIYNNFSEMEENYLLLSKTEKQGSENEARMKDLITIKSDVDKLNVIDINDMEGYYNKAKCLLNRIITTGNTGVSNDVFSNTVNIKKSSVKRLCTLDPLNFDNSNNNKNYNTHDLSITGFRAKRNSILKIGEGKSNKRSNSTKTLPDSNNRRGSDCCCIF